MLSEQEISILKMVGERKIPIGNKEVSAILKELKIAGYVHYPANKGWQLTTQGAEYLHSAAPEPKKLTRRERNQILWKKHLEEWRANQ